MEQSPSWEAMNRSGSQEISTLLWKSKFNYRVDRSPPPVPVRARWMQPTTFHPVSPRFLQLLSSHLYLGLPSDSLLQQTDSHIFWEAYSISFSARTKISGVHQTTGLKCIFMQNVTFINIIYCFFFFFFLTPLVKFESRSPVVCKVIGWNTFDGGSHYYNSTTDTEQHRKSWHIFMSSVRLYLAVSIPQLLQTALTSIGS